MIGSPDLLTFSTEPEFREASPEPTALPEELSVPLYLGSEKASPWSASVQFKRDFILVSEFSEQVGPQPLLTIPDKAEAGSAFDLNRFSLRIMSVDYQTVFAGPGGYPRLNFVEDSAVVLGYSEEGAYAYVHHLTLYDLEARGFVRPFCLAYVSGEETKLMGNFCRLSSEFSRAAECLKTGNRKNFANELDKKLADLEYSRAALLGEREIRGTTAPEERELASLEKAISEHRGLLKQVTSFPNRKLGHPNFLPYEADTDPTEASDSCSHTPKLVRASVCRRFDQPLKSLEQLCDEYFLEQMLRQLRAIEKSFRGDASSLLSRRLARSLLPQLGPAGFLFEHLEAKVEWQQAPEPCASCVETVPIRLSGHENSPAPLESDGRFPAAAAGSASSGESIEVLGVEKALETLGSRELTPEPFPSATFQPRTRSVATRRENSEDSVEVLSTTDLFVPDDLRASYPYAIREETLLPSDDSSDRFSSCSLISAGLERLVQERGASGRRRRRGRVGRAALQFLRQFPFAAHAAYSLLSGRTLVVLGSDEATVRRWVMGLSLYTPRSFVDQETVQPWTSDPLQLTDLLTWKLVGLNRAAFASSPGVPLCLTRYGRYLSVLDVDQKTLRCPAYGGSLICPLVEPRAQGMRGTTYFLYAQTLMGRLVSRAFLHTFCHGTGDDSDRAEHFRRRFHPNDLKIIGYLSEVIVRHVVGTDPTTLGFSYSACTTFRL